MLSAGTYVTTSGETKELLKTDGTPHPYSGTIEPGADLSGNLMPNSGANLSYADLSDADFSNVDLTFANLSFANLSGASFSMATLDDTGVSGADFSGANFNNVFIGSEMAGLFWFQNTIWTTITQSEYDSVVAERDARPTQSAYDIVVNERDALLAKFGSNLIAVDNGVANLGVDIETSEDLSTWTTSGSASATVTIDKDAQFLRFKMTDDPDSLSDVYQLFHTQSWTQETGYKRVAHIRYPETDAQSHPVLILLHGAGSNAYSKIAQYIDLNNYIIVALQGYNNKWNIQTEPTKADDLDYIENIINQLKTFSDVDASNISLLGSSNGAAMVNRAMIELPAGTFKNAITLASQLSTDQYRDDSFWGDDNNDGIYNKEYTLSQDLRVLSLHGTNDTTIPYDGGYVNFIKRTFIEARESNLILARALGYSGDLATSTTPFIEKPEIVKYEYLGGDAVHYQFIGGNHGIGGFKEEINTIIEDFISDN